MKLVLDATPIIHSAKTRLHALFGSLDAEFFTTPAIQKEVLAGGEFAEKSVIEQLLREKIRVVQEKTGLKSTGLHAGEASCIALAEEKDAVLVSDDRVARTVAKARDLKAVHTSFLLFRALEKRAIKRSDAEDLLEELIGSGWYCDAETLAKIYNALKKYD